MYRGCIALGVFACAGTSTALAQQLDSHWTSAVGGSWSNAARWSTPSAAINGTPAGTTYRAYIDAVGASYSVFVGAAVTVDEAFLDSANATISFQNYFRAIDGLHRTAGTVFLDGGSINDTTLNLNGGSLFVNNRVNNLLNNAVINGTLDMRSTSGLNPGFARISNGLTVNGVWQMRQDARVYVEGDQTIHAGQILCNTGASSGGRFENGTGFATSTLTFAAPVTLDVSSATGAQIVTYGFVNDGAVSVSGSGSELTIGVKELTNNGQLAVSGGATRLTITVDNGVFVNDGSISAASAPATISAPAGMTIGSAGSLGVSGATGSLSVSAGFLTNDGTLTASGGGTLILGANSGSFVNNGTVTVTDATLRLSGNMDTASFQSIQATNSRLSLEGNVDNSGSTITLDSTTGSWEANNASITGGVVNLNDGATFRLNMGFGVTGHRSLALDGVTLNGSLNLPNIGSQIPTLTIDNGLDLTGTISSDGSQNTIFVRGDQTLSGGTYTLNAGRMRVTPSPLASGVGTTVTFGPGTLVQGGSAFITGSGSQSDIEAVVNQGVISANQSGKTLAIEVDSFENAGSVTASNGGTVSVGVAGPPDGSVWTNSGQISVQGGNLIMKAATIRFDPGTSWSRSGGTVTLAGRVDNSGRALVLDTSTGSWLSDSGTIEGGTLELRNGTSIGFSGTVKRLTMDGVALASDFSVSTANATLQIVNGLGLGGNELSITGANSKLSAVGSQTIDDGSILLSPSASGRTTLEVGAGSTVTLGEALLVHGGSATVGDARIEGYLGQNQLLVNEGSIGADAGKWLRIHMHRFINNGLVDVAAGGTVEIEDDLTSWANHGTMRIGAGGVLDLGGTVTTAELGTIENNGGTVRFRGELINTGATFSLGASSGNWQFFSVPTIKGGTITTTGGQSLNVTNSMNLNDVTLEGDIRVDAGAVNVLNSFSLDGTVRLLGSGTAMHFRDSTTLDGGTIFFDPTGGGAQRVLNAQQSTLTLASAVIVRGGNGRLITDGTSTIINQGLISADISGQSITIDTARFFNEGTIEAINGGSIVYSPPLARGIEMALWTPTNSGVLSIDAQSMMLFPSDLAQTATGRTTIELSTADGQALSGRLVIDGSANLLGELSIIAGSGFNPAEGMTFIVLHAPTVTGWFSSVELPALSDGLYWNSSALASSGVISIVPAPGGILAIAAFVGAFSVTRRRKGAL